MEEPREGEPENFRKLALLIIAGAIILTIAASYAEPFIRSLYLRL